MFVRDRGNGVVYTVKAFVPSNFSGNLFNTATVTPPTGTTDPDLTDNSSTETDTPAPVSDLVIAKTSTSLTYTAGDTVTWMITVTNDGPSNVVGAKVSDDINNSLTRVTWTAVANGSGSVTNTRGMGNLLNSRVSIAYVRVNVVGF